VAASEIMLAYRANDSNGKKRSASISEKNIEDIAIMITTEVPQMTLLPGREGKVSIVVPFIYASSHCYQTQYIYQSD
jgi:hypothetical protein